MIIGRTSTSAETNSKFNYLSKQKYFLISHIARDFIIENTIFTLPVNLSKIVQNNCWKTVRYSKLKDLNFSEYDSIMKLNYGFTQQIGTNNYIIFYNDQIPLSVQRFTIAHEIGHIVLNHFNVPIENREQEANMFAARLLMPMCVLLECKISSEQELSSLCHVSEISAHYRYERLQMLKKRNKFYTDPNEIKLKSQFDAFIQDYLKNKNAKK